MQSIATKCIRFKQFGSPKEVLFVEHLDLDLGARMTADSVLVRWLASPINPVDLFVVQGQYAGYRPKLPATAGMEGVGTVEKLGSGKTGQQFHVGDRVIRFNVPNKEDPAGGGIWTTQSIVPAHVLLKIDTNMDLVSAATLGINPPTAYAMLREMVGMEKDDCVVQNGANSGVGRAVIQLAKYFGYQTINLIRRHEKSDRIADELRELGADWLFTQEEFAEIIAGPHKLPLAKLGLDCVGGESAYLVSQLLSDGGTLLSYGVISGQPAKVEPEIPHQFFSLSKFTTNPKNADKVKAMFSELQQLIADGKLRPPPAEFRSMDKFGEALDGAISHGTKQILLIDESSTTS